MLNPNVKAVDGPVLETDSVPSSVGAPGKPYLSGQPQWALPMRRMHLQLALPVDVTVGTAMAVP